MFKELDLRLASIFFKLACLFIYSFLHLCNLYTQQRAQIHSFVHLFIHSCNLYTRHGSQIHNPEINILTAPVRRSGSLQFLASGKYLSRQYLEELCRQQPVLWHTTIQRLLRAVFSYFSHNYIENFFYYSRIPQNSKKDFPASFKLFLLYFQH